MRRADAFVLVLPCGRSAHLEFGWGIGMDKKALVYMPVSQEPELMYALASKVCVSLDEVVEALR